MVPRKLISAFIVSVIFFIGSIAIHTNNASGILISEAKVATFDLFIDSAIKRSPRSVLINEDFLKKYKDENHNHKPVFINCANYAPVIKEEQMPGSPVIQVFAKDIDPPEAGGTITYSFVKDENEKMKFDINNVTGWIKTTHLIDRDEPAREKSFYLTVLATDNGLPQLDDVCTFKVTIEDINDNAPVFDKVTYVESVPQDKAIGSEVMRISATDIDDGNNSIVQYSLVTKNPADWFYFRIEKNTGAIYLNSTIDKSVGYKFSMTATAQDMGNEPRANSIAVDIKVVESHKKAPTFTYLPHGPVRLLENFSDFSASIARVEAASNIEESPDYFLFELVIGRTEQTNKENTFRLESNKNVANIKLSKPLDYESITDYTLIIRVLNKYQISAETVIQIEVLDVNDNIPVFVKRETGSVLENQSPGTFVMQVRAIDNDASSAFNIVRYRLENYQDLFAIDKDTGNITTLSTFDRESEMYYPIKVIAYDNAPSAIFKTGEPNTGEKNFQIEVADMNDNPPKFTQSIYIANSIPEDANINSLVTEVKAVDPDTASVVIYSIIDGNVDNSFYIENTTGKIRVKNSLDYEKITEYNLEVRAFDGIFNDTAKVIIYISNINDNPPIFNSFKKDLSFEEEKMIEGCITKVSAYDPDIKDRSEDQHIVYSILKSESNNFIGIKKDGCMFLKKPLDRDPPLGHPDWIVNVIAQDEDGGATSLRNVETVKIALIDINDNKPFLDMPYPINWYERSDPGKITQLNAMDYDSEEAGNGAPFHYSISNSAHSTILSSFKISGDSLYAEVVFDREERKSYDIPIEITDNGKPAMTGLSVLTVIIGDINDNAMKNGSSSIFVYNLEGNLLDFEIGRVYVKDPDDWDLEDKYFSWYEKNSNFYLNEDTGMITLRAGKLNGTFVLEFIVIEESELIKRHKVYAVVNVTVKLIPREAVEKSGSIRFHGVSAEDFIVPVNNATGYSKRNILQEHLADITGVPTENIDVLTVLHSPYTNNSVLDVRFSAHGSPYYASQKLNIIASKDSNQIASVIGANVLMINIDECLVENKHCNSSCSTYLNISSTPYAVFTNTSSFVGIRAVVDPLCSCMVAKPIECENGGTLKGDTCECPPEFEGPRCESLNELSIGFNSNGYAIYEPRGQVCDASHIGVEIIPENDDALVFYYGPVKYFPELGIQDFMSLELQKGYAVLYVDYGSGTVRLKEDKFQLTDGKMHRIDIFWKKDSIEMKVDNCSLSACLRLAAPRTPNKFLNVNGPLQIGGTISDLVSMSNNYSWEYTPKMNGFIGCVRTFIFNNYTYRLSTPILEQNTIPGCSHGIARAIQVKANFLVAFLTCITIFLILILAVVVYRKKTDNLPKDVDDVTENIINYEDEGGGEADTTCDINALRNMLMYNPEENSKTALGSVQRRDAPDIRSFLDAKKEYFEKDSDINQFDDLRHYAYEGEENSDGSLSSLASCTDDEDLNFDQNFDPRFRKLIDIYGEESSGDETHNYSVK